MKDWVTSVILMVMFLAFLLFTGVIATADAATLVDKTEKTELWQQVTTVNGKTVACYWIQNRKGMASKVSTGLSCVVLDPNPDSVVVYKCRDDNHEHPSYERHDGGVF
jgi:hypothetical protein